MHNLTRCYLLILTFCIVQWLPGGFYGTPIIAQTPTEINGFHRSGQTFLTWRERSDVTNEFYCVYRHTEVINESNLVSAELVAVIPDSSAMHHTERWKEIESWLGYVPVQRNFIIHDLGSELDDDQGLFVYTTPQSKAGTAYYAITSKASGVENQTIISGVNSLITGITETVANPAPVLVWQAESGFARVYTQFMDFNHWNPTFSGLAFNYFVSLPQGYNANESYPLYVYLEGWGGRYSFGDSSGTPWDLQAIQILPDDPRQTWYYGYSRSHNYGDNWSLYIYSELTPPASGQISNFTEQRILRAIHDVIRDPRYNVDENRIYAYGHSMGASGALALGMRYPDVFAAVMCNQPMTNYSGDDPAVDANWLEDFLPKWGSLTDNLTIVNEGAYASHLIKYNGQGVYDWMNHQQNMLERQEDEMAYIHTLHGTLDNVIEWATQGKAWNELMNTQARRGWQGVAEVADHTWVGFFDTPNFTWHAFNFRKDKSFPAFTNFSLNLIQPDGLSYYNFGLEWSCSWNDFAGDIVDSEHHYEIVVRLYDPGLVSYETIPNSGTVDITPRRLQQFKVTPGETYHWENVQLPGATAIQSGAVTADEYGLVTIVNFLVTKDGNRLCISSAGISVEENENHLPYTYNLEQNYPNPFNSTTHIRFSIPKTSHVELIIYSISGRSIVTVVDEILESGKHAINWDGRDQKGVAVACGIYFYSFKTDNFLAARKLILVR